MKKSAFGAASVLGTEATVYYTTFTGTRYLGRLADLAIALLKMEDACQLRFFLEGAVCQMALMVDSKRTEPFFVEFGIYNQQFVVSVSVHYDLLEAKEADRFVQNMKRLVGLAHTTFFRIYEAEKKCELLLASVSDEPGFHEIMLTADDLEEILPTKYLHAGDTNATKLLSEYGDLKSYRTSTSGVFYDRDGGSLESLPVKEVVALSVPVQEAVKQPVVEPVHAPESLVGQVKGKILEMFGVHDQAPPVPVKQQEQKPVDPNVDQSALIMQELTSGGLSKLIENAERDIQNLSKKHALTYLGTFVEEVSVERGHLTEAVKQATHVHQARDMSAKKQIAYLSAEVQARDTLIQKHQQLAKSLKQALEKVTKEKFLLDKKMKLVLDDRESVQKKIKNLELNLTDADRVIEEKSSHEVIVLEMTRELEESNKTIALLTEELQRAKNQVVDIKNAPTPAQFKKQAELIQMQLTLAKKENQRLNVQVLELKSALLARGGEANGIKDLLGQMSALRKSLQDKEDELEKVTGQMQELDKERLRLETLLQEKESQEGVGSLPQAS